MKAMWAGWCLWRNFLGATETSAELCDSIKALSINQLNGKKQISTTSKTEVGWIYEKSKEAK